ncbi:MAG: radical SAM protein, partial [Cytophagales bacterium]|nr:radical SAM protein [Cytophagales bacterium]
PLLRHHVLDLFHAIGDCEEVTELCVTTNGLLLKKFARELKKAGVTSVNISIDSLNADKFKAITRMGGLHHVLDGIEEVKRLGFESIKLNVVLMKGVNDDEIEDFVNLTRHDPIDVRFIELMPMGNTAGWSEDKYLSNATILHRVPELVKIPNQSFSSPAMHYQLPEAFGRVGVISSISGKFCDSCNRVRVTSDGKLKLCLHSDDEIDLKPLLNANEDLRPTLIDAIFHKPKEHHLELGQYVSRNMSQIGG